MIPIRTTALQTVATLWRRFMPRPGDLSLRTRLRLFVLVLMFSVVTALSLLHLYTLGAFGFEDVLQRAQHAGNEVKYFVTQRLKEMWYDLPAERRTEAPRTLYASLLAADDELPVFLRDIVSNSRAIVEISISDASGHILADSLPYRAGQRTARLPDFEAWAKKSPWQKLSEIFSERRDYQVVLPIALQGQKTAVFNIDVVLSSILLRQIVLPQVRSVALIFLGGLLLSLLLAVVVSNLVLRPLDTIGQAIDRISRGELANASWVPEGSAKEFAAVQSKLNLLGQQYRGARQDAIQLRSNVEQLIERLEEVVLLFDRDDRLVMAGRAAESILARGRWEIMGRTITELFPPSTALGAALRNAIELRQPLRDVALALESGPGTRVLASAEVLESFPDHQRIGTLITLRDAETRRQIRSQLDVSARLAAISRLTGGVAHEIKNPLQAITVHMEVLKSKLADHYDEVGVEIETIAREILRLDRVVKTFLDFTRPVDLKMRDIGMVALVQDVAALVGPSAGRQNVHVEVDSDSEEIFVHGDPDLLQQAILNVVANGVEAMKSGGLLRIQLAREGDECCVSISDEGAGIAPEVRDQIFHLYFTTKGKGSGIGLAVTFRVVQLHNGTIDFTSESGRGATFRLRIPAIYKEEFGRAQSIATEGTTGD
ncbi:MAG TPA: ATP-binding protein [Bryobacteraceae bacterium]|nr:ATP-binding protein [Bryobacteraceae bacterium]